MGGEAALAGLSETGIWLPAAAHAFASLIIECIIGNELDKCPKGMTDIKIRLLEVCGVNAFFNNYTALNIFDFLAQLINKIGPRTHQLRSSDRQVLYLR